MKTPFTIHASALAVSILLTLAMVKTVADYAYPQPGSALYAARSEAVRVR